MRLYKFYSDQSAERNLKSNRLKVSLIDELNDPFECRPYALSSPADRMYWDNMLRETWKDKGIISFSEKWSNPVLWAHYANSHAGLAIGVDVPDEKAYKVIYQEKRESLNDLQSLERKSLLQKIEAAPLVKFKHWHYETEYRMFIKFDKKVNEKLVFHDFSDNMKLSEIIIGTRSSFKSESIRNLVHSQVKITTARLAFRDFRVVTQKAPKQQK